MYLGPHGMQPIELARKCDMARQEMNYVLSGLEWLGYVERVTEAAAWPESCACQDSDADRARNGTTIWERNAPRS